MKSDASKTSSILRITLYYFPLMSPEMDDVPLPDLILVPTKKLRPGTLQGAYLKQVTRLNDFSQVFSAPQLAHQILSCPLASCRPEVVG